MEKELEFGTAGIRGILRPGLDGINAETVTRTAVGYAKFITDKYGLETKGVIIGHDTRNGSYEFAEIIAKTLISYGVKATLFHDNEFQPTPVVSYTIRKKGFIGGVMITASHNPKEYNGIKIYDHTGKQLLSNDTSKIATHMKSILEVGNLDGEISFLTQTIIDEYIADVDRVKLEYNKIDLRVAYTPVQGTGGPIAVKLFEKYNISHYLVDEQMVEDANFTACESLNPEEPLAYEKLLNVGLINDCDICFITDPDADRVGIAVNDKGNFTILSGNEIAALYLNYKISKLDKYKCKDSYIVTSFPSGHLAQVIAKSYGVDVKLTHVGFKNIASIIEKNENKKLLLAYEESYGSIISEDLTRDKDSFQGIIAYTEMINHYKKSGKHILDVLNEIYRKHGKYLNYTFSIVIDTETQNQIFENILKLELVAGEPITKKEDFRLGKNDVEQQNFLKIYLKSGSWFAIRPSGTEPKVKIYIEEIIPFDSASSILKTEIEKMIKEWITK